MKLASFVLFVAVAAVSATAQNTTNSSVTPPPGTISQGSANAFGTANLSFTNRSGQVYTASQFASQLENLRTAVEQTLPMLQSFNQDFAARNPGSQSLSGVLSRVLGGNSQNSGANNTNFLGVLSNLLTSNRANSTPAVSGTTVRDLQTLQKDLEPIPGLLQALNVNGSANAGVNTSYGYSAPSTNTFTGPTNNVSPTGR